MPRPIDELEQKVIDDVKNYGVHIVHVADDELGPSFAYSVGLFENYVHPEIIIIGLKQELAHILLNNMAFDIKKGKTFESGEFHDGVLDDFLCYFDDVPRSNYKEYVGWGLWYYDGGNFPLVQCDYPTVAGKFPWEMDFPEDARFFRQLLVKPPKMH